MKMIYHHLQRSHQLGIFLPQPGQVGKETGVREVIEVKEVTELRVDITVVAVDDLELMVIDGKKMFVC